MVVYYSLSQKTKKYAEELAAVLNDSIFELKETKPRKGIIGFITGGYQSIAKKEVPVVKLPDISGEDRIYVCTPIWAATIPPAIRYFRNHCDFKGKELGVLITCGNPSSIDAYASNVLTAFDGTGCTPGKSIGFVCPSGQTLDSATMREQISTLLENQ